jgi:transposase
MADLENNARKGTMDRDLNAAINLRNYALSSTVSVCGEEGSGSGRKTGTKPASVKQKSSIESARVGLYKS